MSTDIVSLCWNSMSSLLLMVGNWSFISSTSAGSLRMFSGISRFSSSTICRAMRVWAVAAASTALASLSVTRRAPSTRSTTSSCRFTICWILSSHTIFCSKNTCSWSCRRLASLFKLCSMFSSFCKASLVRSRSCVSISSMRWCCISWYSSRSRVSLCSAASTSVFQSFICSRRAAVVLMFCSSLSMRVSCCLNVFEVNCS
mmetsp:Transcript_5140/g.9728  ORF Transcript_5140/g.9728 Transcript_5140/m.9728 type:complete len:201 (-) Transcript_5140:410-1012(-)